MRKTNETVTITVKSPLLRPGLTLSAQTSKRYAETAARDLLDIARAINGTAGIDEPRCDAPGDLEET